MSKTSTKFSARKFRVIMGERNMKRNEVAKGVGVSKMSVTGWANGTMSPNVAHLFSLASFLKVGIMDLTE